MKYDVAAKWSPFLATRERGRRVREEIEQRLAQLSAGDNLVLDFSGVEGITVSFGDECVAKLILARSSGDFADRGLVIEGANEDVTETLEAVLSRRKFYTISLNSTGEPEVLGEKRLAAGNVGCRHRTTVLQCKRPGRNPQPHAASGEQPVENAGGFGCCRT